MKTKKISDSQVIMHELVLPNDTNRLGNVLGGRVMHLMDICAAMSAYKHTRSHVVTASVDQLNILAQAKKGDIMILKSSVNYVSNTSMEVGVKIHSEDPMTGEINHTASAYLTFVSLDRNGKPKKVPSLTTENEEQRKWNKEGEKRSQQRKKLLEELRSDG